MCMKICVCVFWVEWRNNIPQRITFREVNACRQVSSSLRVGQGSSVIALGTDTVLNLVRAEHTLCNAETFAGPKQRLRTPSPLHLPILRVETVPLENITTVKQ